MPAVVTVWDVASGRSRTLPGSLPGDDVAFSPDGRWLVVGGVGDYRFYRVGSWHPGAVLPRDAGDSTPGPLAFARDGSLLAIARTLTDVQLVDTVTGRALATLQAPEPRQVSWLCFSPDGGRLAAATAGDHVQLWDLRLIRQQLAAMGLDMTPAELRKSGAQGRVDQFRRAVREAVDREFPPAAGKRATRADIQAIVDTLAAETSAAASPWFGRNTPSRYAFEEAQAQVETVNQVPPAEKRKIESALRGRGLPVTDQAIVNLFNAQLQKVRGDR